MIEFARDGLHRGRIKTLGFEHERERIAGEFFRVNTSSVKKRRFHVGLIRTTARIRGSGLD